MHELGVARYMDVLCQKCGRGVTERLKVADQMEVVR